MILLRLWHIYYQAFIMTFLKIISFKLKWHNLSIFIVIFVFLLLNERESKQYEFQSVSIIL